MPPPLHLLPEAIQRWSDTDPRLADAARAAPPGKPPLGRDTAFAALCESVVYQQVSIAAGDAIWQRFEAACGGEVAPAAVLALDDAAVRGAGVSRPKARYVRGIARAVADGLDLEALREAPDSEVVAALTALKGVGVWTAKMHLIFHLGRPDVLPHEDLGLQVAVSRLYGVPREAAAGHMRELAPAWSPYASLASLVLWSWRRVAGDAPPQ